jgi:adenosylcobinamide-GDP ribazoletransferase
MQVLSPARSEGLGASAGQPDRFTAGTALLLAAVVAGLALSPVAAIAAIAAAAAAAAAVAWLAIRQIGGHTGDVLGTIEQAAEIAALLAVVAVS